MATITNRLIPTHCEHLIVHSSPLFHLCCFAAVLRAKILNRFLDTCKLTQKVNPVVSYVFTVRVQRAHWSPWQPWDSQIPQWSSSINSATKAHQHWIVSTSLYSTHFLNSLLFSQSRPNIPGYTGIVHWTSNQPAHSHLPVHHQLSTSKMHRYTHNTEYNYVTKTLGIFGVFNYVLQ